MSDDEIGGELDRVLRVALSASGQFAERIARSQADADRNRHAATLDAQRDAERQLARQVEAGRAVYGAVREPQLWEQPNAQRRLGEALAAAEALRDADPVATPAAQYIRAEARRRHGVDSDAWLAAGVQMYLEDLNERADRGPAADELHRPGEATELVADIDTTEMLSDGSADVSADSSSTTQPLPLQEAAVAAQAFPRDAAAELNGPRSEKAPKARKSTSRTRQRDRGR